MEEEGHKQPESIKLNEKLEVPWEMNEDKNIDESESDKPSFGVAVSGKAIHFMFLN